GLGVERTRPGSAVGRHLDPVRHREVLRVPVDDEAAELAIAAEVEDEPLWIRASLALPLRRRRGIDGPARLETGPEAPRRDRGEHAVRTCRLARFERPAVDPQGA